MGRGRVRGSEVARGNGSFARNRKARTQLAVALLAGAALTLTSCGDDAASSDAPGKSGSAPNAAAGTSPDAGASGAGTHVAGRASEIRACIEQAGVTLKEFDVDDPIEKALAGDSDARDAMTLDFSGSEEQFGLQNGTDAGSGEPAYDTPATIDVVVYDDANTAEKHSDLAYDAEFKEDPDDEGMVRVRDNVVVNPADRVTPGQNELLDSCLPAETDT